ncbi:MAG: response regulator [Myxococcota bacterium]
MRETGRPPTIVVIDNSELVLAATREVLESAGYRVVTHSRPAGAVALIIQEKPDVVLLEVNIGGDSVAKLFGKAQPNSSTIVLLYSSLSAAALEAKAAACGAHGFIRKTPDGVDFLRQINGWLKKSGVSSQYLRVAPRLEPNEEERVSRPSGARAAVREARTVSDANLPAVPALSEAPRASGTMAVSGRVVLFIDDDMEMLSSLRREVQGEPYSAEFALSGNQGLKRILSPTPPDLVVSDLLMQEPDGAAVYQRALAADPNWRTRFLFLTGAYVHQKMAGLLDGFEGVILEKPVRGDELRTAIRRRLSILQRASALGGSQAR